MENHFEHVDTHMHTHCVHRHWDLLGVSGFEVYITLGVLPCLHLTGFTGFQEPMWRAFPVTQANGLWNVGYGQEFSFKVVRIINKKWG